jgi:hypothetical protein
MKVFGSSGRWARISSTSVFLQAAGNTLRVNLRDRFPGATSPSHAK